MSNILELIANETHGKSYQSYKFTFEDNTPSIVDYDDHSEITWQKSGETKPEKTIKNLKSMADELRAQKIPPLFTYFLDGSRRTYKVDDIAYSNNVYPIIAGQVGISCCIRQEGEMRRFKYAREIAIALPPIANQMPLRQDFFPELLRSKINSLPSIKDKGISFTKVLIYSADRDKFEKLENKGIARIQDLMISKEIEIVTELVKSKDVDNMNYLLKDGSLQYNVDKYDKKERERFQAMFNYVVGVSKSFNPANCTDKRGKNISDTIAQLPLYARTPVSLYRTERNEGMFYAVWYVRIRDSKYTHSAFDGILKIEKILRADGQTAKLLETEEVDLITANIINERNPTCYGTDNRWANHLYPVYVTEMFAKSKYLSNTMFLNIF